MVCVFLFLVTMAIVTRIMSQTDSPTVTNFTVNSLSQSLEVMEGDNVTFSCQAEGYPRPALFIKGQRSNRFDIRDFTYENNKLIGEITKVMRCQDTDTYTCTAVNDVGGLVSKSVSVFVRCRPQLLQFHKEDGIIKEFTITYGCDMKIEIHIRGYPKPSNYTLIKVGNISSHYGEIDLIAVELSKVTDYNVTFTVREWPLGTVVVWMLNLTEEDIGQFVLKIGNGIGDGLNYRFNVNVEPELYPQRQDQERHELNAEYIIRVGLYVACFIILILGVVIFILAMKIRRRNKASKNVIMLQPSPDYEDISVSLLEEAYEDINQQSQHCNETPVGQPPRHNQNGYGEGIDPLSNLFEQRTEHFQGTTAPSLTGMNLVSNGREKHHGNSTGTFPRNKHTVDYLDVIDTLLNVNKDNPEEKIPLKPLRKNQTSVPSLFDSNTNLDRDWFQVYATTEL